MFSLFFLSLRPLSAQEEKEIRVAFWNMENFFDPFVDSTKSYNEFTENGMQHYTKSRFYKKRNNLYKTILAMSGNRPIGIMGVCEIESDYVLNMLFLQTPLKKYNYRWVHFDSPDNRGIDAAIVYSKDCFRLVYSEAIPYHNPEDTAYHSRDIVYGKFIGNESDTLHVFVNHWPSRYGGELETVGSRACAATILRSKVDSISNSLNGISETKIIIMGDLNDSPEDVSVRDVLNAKGLDECDSDSVLVNLFSKADGLGFDGTLKHQYHWQIFDQIIISQSLMKNAENLHYKDGSARIFAAHFLLEDDDQYKGVKIIRTYLGPKYIGGFSDHLPVYIDLIMKLQSSLNDL
jgi:Endonuclease/Exonuclease/phosphatase family.